MAKTIKEMAYSYARDYLFSPCGAKAPDEHYTAGANAVLEEVADILQKYTTALGWLLALNM